MCNRGVRTLASSVPFCSDRVDFAVCSLTPSYSGSHDTNGPWISPASGLVETEAPPLWTPDPVCSSSSLRATFCEGFKYCLSMRSVSPHQTSVEAGSLSEMCQNSAKLLEIRSNSLAHFLSQAQTSVPCAHTGKSGGFQLSNLK